MKALRMLELADQIGFGGGGHRRVGLRISAVIITACAGQVEGRGGTMANVAERETRRAPRT
jgi:hypothetical protein